MPNSVSDVKEQRVSETCDTLKHSAGFVELEISALGDDVKQYAVLELSGVAVKAYRPVVR